MKHTEGPWEITQNQFNKTVFIGEYPIFTECGSRENNMRHWADARLIAAAPDLLEACKELVDGPGLCGNEPWRVESLRNAIAKCRAAIEKAEGRG